MENKKISVIVPSYNQGNFISNVIKSVLGQTYTNWELIIQDGASTDNTIEICEKFTKQDKRISFVSEKDSGFADAVNKALDKATGTLAIIQSSDDFFASKNVFQEALHIYEQAPDLILISGLWVVVDEHLKHLATGEKACGYIPAETVYTLKNHFIQGATFFSLNRALEVGKLDPSVDMVADTDFFIRMACTHPIAINSIYQTSQTWAGIVVQEGQRSSELSKFASGRAKMAFKHYYNDKIPYAPDFKKSNANNQIHQVVGHFLQHNLPSDEIFTLYKELNDINYPTNLDLNISKKIKRSIKKIITPTHFEIKPSPNSYNEIFFGKPEISTFYSYNWFD